MQFDKMREANIAAARLLRLDPIESVVREGVVLVGRGQTERDFDMFNNPRDTLDTAKILAKEYGITIQYREDCDCGTGFWQCAPLPGKDTYEEALAVAVYAITYGLDKVYDF